MPIRTFQLCPAATDTDIPKAQGFATVLAPFPDSPTPDQRAYSDRVGALIKDLRAESSARSVVRRFHQAYEYRASYDWLGESGKLPGLRNKNGVAYALRSALSQYNPSWTQRETQESLDASNVNADERRWLVEFAIAAKEADKDDLSKIQFAWAVTEAEHCDDFDEISDAVLRKHLLAALKQYANRRKSGTSLEPW